MFAGIAWPSRKSAYRDGLLCGQLKLRGTVRSKILRIIWTDLCSIVQFEAIVVLSQGTEWRVEGLRDAARASGVRLQILCQRKTPEQLLRTSLELDSMITRGDVMARIGHTELLNLVFSNGWTSVLIIEDNMDWDIDLRNQTRNIAAAVLALTGGEDSGQAPYGMDWDLLWMGHCNDLVTNESPKLTYKDHSVGALDGSRGLDRHITNVLREGERCVHYSENTACSFGYAISAEGVKNLLPLVSLGQEGAFDVLLMRACRDSIPRCVSVYPEVFKPYTPTDGVVSAHKAGDNSEKIRSAK